MHPNILARQLIFNQYASTTTIYFFLFMYSQVPLHLDIRTKNRKMKKLIVLLLLTTTLVCFAKDDKTTVSAKLNAVTIFRSGVEMNHQTVANLKAGNNELVIDQLSNSLDVNSIQVKISDAITLLGTEYSNNYVATGNKSPRVKDLEDTLAELRKTLNKYQQSLNNIAELQKVLQLNREIKGTQNGLSVAELIKLMDYFKQKTIELQTEQTNTEEKKNKLQEQIDKLAVQLNDERLKNNGSNGRITLQLVVADAGKYSIEISYISYNARWTPFYDLRVDDLKLPIKLIYKAQISQTTGIDWKQVKLSLSTANPGQTGEAPILKSWFLSYISPYGYSRSPEYASNTIPTLKSMSMDESFGSTGDSKSKARKPLENYVTVSDYSLNVSFDIDVPYDIPTNGKQQTAVLKTYQMPAVFKHYAVPKLDREAYILAEITDWEKLNLLPGSANVIFEGTYTGKTFIDPNSSQDTLNLTIGKDKRVVVKRDKLVDFSSTKFLGSNKLQKFTYEITLKNNKKETINLQLKDQFPLSTNKDIEVDLIESNGAVLNNDIGVYNWQLAIPANESKKIRFTYSIKYPKDKQLNLN